MALTSGAIIAIIVIILGIILLIIGIITYELNVQNRTGQQWWVWFLLIGGLIVAIIGAIWLVFGLRSKPKPITTTTTVIKQT